MVTLDFRRIARVLPIMIVVLAGCQGVIGGHTRLLPRFESDAGIVRLAQVQAVASQADVQGMGVHRQFLLEAGIAERDLGGGRVVSTRVYCCGGPNEESEALWAYVPPAIDLAVGDVVEMRMGDPAVKGRLEGVNVVLAIAATAAEVPGRCRWVPPDETKWVRVLYCDGIESKGWIHKEGGLYPMWLKPRDGGR